MEKKIKVVIKLPGEDPKWIEIENTLEAFQQEVCGYIEVIPFWEGDIDGSRQMVLLICNEEGKIRGMDPNFYIWNDRIFGPAVFAGVNGEECADCPLAPETIMGIIGG